MQFLKTLFWVIIAVFVAILASRNWHDVTLNLWGDIQADIKVPVLIFLIVAAGIGVVLLVLGSLLGPKRPGPDSEKLSPYECGFEAFEDARMKFDVRYYLVAILFILFDLEIAFLFPWAVVLDSIGTFGLIAMGIFLFILVVGAGSCDQLHTSGAGRRSVLTRSVPAASGYERC